MKSLSDVLKNDLHVEKIYKIKCNGCGDEIISDEWHYRGIELKICEECGDMYLPSTITTKDNMFQLLIDFAVDLNNKHKDNAVVKYKYIYIAVSDMFIKIGITSDHVKRFNQFNFDVKDYYLYNADNAIMIEKHLHKIFKQYQLSKELFHIEILDDVLNYCDNKMSGKMFKFK